MKCRALCRLAHRRLRTGSQAFCSGHEVVVIAVATSIPEVHTPGGDDVEVVA